MATTEKIFGSSWESNWVFCGGSLLPQPQWYQLILTLKFCNLFVPWTTVQDWCYTYFTSQLLHKIFSSAPPPHPRVCPNLSTRWAGQIRFIRWLVRCSPCAPEFNQSNPHDINHGKKPILLSFLLPDCHHRTLASYTPIAIPIVPHTSLPFALSQHFSVQIKWPQARLTNHHKQDFPFLASALNYKFTQLSP